MISLVYKTSLSIVLAIAVIFLFSCTENGSTSKKNRKIRETKKDKKPRSFDSVKKTPKKADPALLHNIKSFRKAKKIMRKIHDGHQIAFYSGCKYNYQKIKKSFKGVVDADSCGYSSRKRKNNKRGRRIEWEHVVPAYAFGHVRECWRKKIPGCKKKGRTCCGKVDEEFRAMESDLHNLRPAIGELNGDRSNLPFAMISGEKRVYGEVDFEIDFDSDTVEPRPEVRGDIARTYFYMQKRYGLKLTDKQEAMFKKWAKDDPVDDWEKERNQRIKNIQGNDNPFIK